MFALLSRLLFVPTAVEYSKLLLLSSPILVLLFVFDISLSLSLSREFTHRVKSISMAKFTSQEVSALKEGGNQVSLSSFSSLRLICLPFVI